MSTGEDLKVERLGRMEVREVNEIWRTCKYCNSEIPPSRRNMAFCDRDCKRLWIEDHTFGGDKR